MSATLAVQSGCPSVEEISVETYATLMPELLQAGVTALAVFIGGIVGGYVATMAAWATDWLELELRSSLFIVFVISGLLRGVVLLWFIPRAEEPRIRNRPHFLKLIFRVARYNSISGIVLDWLTVAEKEQDEK